MIPIFPEFKKLELEDKPEVEKLTQNFPGYSDFNFVSLWGYNTESDIIISLLNGNLVVRFRDYITNELFYSFFGTQKIVDTIEALLKRSREEGINPILKLIPIDEVSQINELSSKYKITEDQDNYDYILSMNEYKSLKDSKYYNHRKLINRFSRNNPEFKVKELDLAKEESIKELIELFYLWEEKKGRKREDTKHELTALNRTLKDSVHLNIKALGVYLENKLIGVIVFDSNHHKYAQSHFLKYHPDYNGINHLLHHFLARQFSDGGFEFMNIEQDLGIEGLRRAKEATKPVSFLKKYTISAK